MAELTYKDGLVVSAPDDISASCSCGSCLTGSGQVRRFMEVVRNWVAQHRRKGHRTRVFDPEELLVRYPDERPN